jgi:hypothetical protein
MKVKFTDQAKKDMRIDDPVAEYCHTHLAIYNIVRYNENRKLVKKFSIKDLKNKKITQY